MYRRLAPGCGTAALAVTLTATAVNAGTAVETTAAGRYGSGGPLPEWSDECLLRVSTTCRTTKA